MSEVPLQPCGNMNRSATVGRPPADRSLQDSDGAVSLNTSSQTLLVGNISLNTRRKRQKPWFFCITVVASVLILIAASLWLIILIQDGQGPGYNQNRAIKFAQLAGAAYCSEEAVTHWKCGTHCIGGMRAVKYCNGSKTKAYVGLWENMAFVSFSGSRRNETESLVLSLQKLENATRWDMCENCSVNRYVLDEWNFLEECIEDSILALKEMPGSEIRVTGHAFGAAVSAVALLALHSKGWKIEESYNFGMPRTGNYHFSRAIRKTFDHRVFRVTHARDPLVQVPKINNHYNHLEPEWFYDRGNFKGFKRCARDNSIKCSGQYPDVDDDLKHIRDHWRYLDIDIGSDCATYDAPGRRRRSRKSRPEAIETV